MQSEIKVFYEPTALARCEEGSTILLRLCAALEAFDIAVDADQSQLDISPAWPILDQEAEWDARFAEQATAGAAGVAPQNAPYGQRAPSNQQNAGASASSSAGSRRLYTATDTERSDGQQQQWREAASDGRGGGWIAAATSEIDKVLRRVTM